MKLWVLAVGQRLPAWAEVAWRDFAKRFPPDLRLELKEVKAADRKAHGVQACMGIEAERLQAAMPKGCHQVVLDEHGRALDTAGLAGRLQAWRGQGRDVAFLIGGPDGLHGPLKAQAHESWRLSDLTLPHALARVLLAEALYRAWTLSIGHPYHRE